MAEKSSRKISLSYTDGLQGRVSFLEMGRKDAPVVVLVHGFAADLLTWQFCLVPMAAKYRVIALELPAHGKTHDAAGDCSLNYMADWLNETLGVLGVEAAHMVGHSMGGRIALALAEANPEKVLSLSLIAPAGIGGDFRREAFERYLSEGSEAAAHAAAIQLVGPDNASYVPVMTASLIAAATPERRETLLRFLRRIEAASGDLGVYDWSQLPCPVTVLWGDQDRVIPLPDGLPNLCVIEGAGHVPHIEASRRVTYHILEFLNVL
ncbi:alpha/beta fold hydrolase [Asticcacaulis sp. YBE204]|uniref:alpha/beta fold hydrolase n=1 Tax=Asticcacaulis sp. YBE204 TaxID=1282363 RepID=UPI0012DD6A1D|nr:alpha/beta fold hydrolase [Asticcacaulis sp. YBE204]